MIATEMRLYGEIPDYRYRLIDYVGSGVLIGASCGTVFHFIRGLRRYSPNGGRLAGAVRAVRANVPRVAGICGTELAVLWAFQSAMYLARDRREDPWNTIAAGAATFGLINARRGAPAAALFALLGASSFAGLAGAYWTFESWHSRQLSSGKEVRMIRGLPEVVPIKRITPCRMVQGDPAGGSIEYRSTNRGTPDRCYGVEV